MTIYLTYLLTIIKLIFKKRERIRRKNDRPLTLLNLDLKILPKALVKRVCKVISKLIHQNQTCVPGRHIENNKHIVQNLIDHINKTDGEIALISIDQEFFFDNESQLHYKNTEKKLFWRKLYQMG